MEPDGERTAEAVLDGIPGLRPRLRARYAAPPRRYHTFEHAGRVAATAASLGADRACLLAAWFHDAVYEPGAPDNEERSARLLLAWLADDVDADRAAELVRVTADHRPARGDDQAAVLCDADLAVLGGTRQEYERYRRRVRAEFAEVDDEQWRTGRAAVLRDLLGRDRIFRTPAAATRWESSARRNIAGELRALRSVS